MSKQNKVSINSNEKNIDKNIIPIKQSNFNESKNDRINIDNNDIINNKMNIKNNPKKLTHNIFPNNIFKANYDFNNNKNNNKYLPMKIITNNNNDFNNNIK